MTSTGELIIDPKQPIPISALEIEVTETAGLAFPLRRSYEQNLINENWNAFVKDMAERKKEDIAKSIAAGTNAYQKDIAHIGGINSMYRFNGAVLDDHDLTISLGITDFKQYVGTSQHALKDPVFRKLLMTAGKADAGDPNFYFANPLAACAAIITADEKVPIGYRSSTVAIYPDTWHVLGGFVKVNGKNKPKFTTRDIVLHENVMTELQQEIGLTDDQVISTDFLGIARNVTTRHPEILYAVRVNISGEQLLEQWRSKARDRFEHRQITLFDRAQLPEFLAEQKGKMVPSGEATLTQYVTKYS